MNPFIWNAVLGILLVLLTRKLWNLQRAFQLIRTIPGQQISWLDPFRTFALLSASVFPWPGMIGHYGGKFSLYTTYGSTILSSVLFWEAQPFFWVADADALKIVTGERHVFQKDVSAYEPLNIYGPNLIGTEGADWKRHRAVAKPAFNEANSALVWTEAIRVVNEWFGHLHQGQKKGDVELDVVPAMTQAALLIISSAGFGRSLTWSSSSSFLSAEDRLPFRDAVLSTTHNIFVKFLSPTWLVVLLHRYKGLRIPYLTDRIRETERGYGDLRKHIIEIVSWMRAGVVDSDVQQQAGEKGKELLGGALLRGLVEANMQESGGNGKGLTDDELLSNVFTFLVAGHETSSHSLAFAFPLLALYPDAQRKIYEEVKRLWPDGIPGSKAGLESSYKNDYPKLEYTVAFFRETLRCYPSEPRLSKNVCADTSLPARRFTPHTTGGESEEFRVPVPKGSVVIMDIYGLHMNPFHWGEDAAEFKPERFIDRDAYRWPRDAFLTFSGGARGCIGSRFAMAESVAILALLVRQYEVLVPADMDREEIGEEERKRVLLGWTTGITLTPTGSRVRLRRRNE